MKKNQKYTQEEMFAAIEYCERKKISHVAYCQEKSMNYQSFKYWVKKYRKEKVQGSFLPVRIERPVEPVTPDIPLNKISFEYPNGVKVHCPVSVPPVVLSCLLKG